MTVLVRDYTDFPVLTTASVSGGDLEALLIELDCRSRIAAS